MVPKSCFVVSPIGAKDSPTRKDADELYDLVLEPALEKYGFKLIRADKLTTSSSITQDIVKWVQNADLCIIDLTGKNPNVMYECGRRHETGKPFIMLAKEAEELPFDINTIRTIFYNVSNGRSIREAQINIQKVVDGLVREGFSPQSSGESLATISDTLRRIERKFDSIAPAVQTPVSNSHLPQLKNLLDNGLTIPEAYIYAYNKRQFDLAEIALIQLLKKEDDPTMKVQYSQAIAEHSLTALKILEENILQVVPDFSTYNWCMVVSSLTRGYIAHGMSKDKLVFFDSVIHHFLPHVPNNEKKAEILNHQQRLFFDASQYDKAIEIGEEVLRLWDTSSYHFNLALNYKYKGDMSNAVKYMTQCLKMGDASTNALAAAYKLYKNNNMEKEAEEAMERLKATSPIKAEVLNQIAKSVPANL